MQFQGTVKRWYAKGFGFISRDDGESDCFVHVSQVLKLGRDKLDEGDRVAFYVHEDRKQPGRFLAMPPMPVLDRATCLQSAIRILQRIKGLSLACLEGSAMSECVICKTRTNLYRVTIPGRPDIVGCVRHIGAAITDALTTAMPQVEITVSKTN
jgi:cold shock CspA family protein